MRQNNKVGRFFLFVIGVSIPFNNVGVPLGSLHFSFGFLAVSVYFLYMISKIKYLPELSKQFGTVVYYPLIMWFVLTLSNYININSRYNTPVVNSSILLTLVFFLLLLLHSLFDKYAIKRALYGFAIGSIIMAIFFMFGIGVDIDIETGRISMFGENLNALGIYMCIGSIILLYDVILKDEFHMRGFRWLLLLSYIPILILLFVTASRTAFLVFSISAIMALYFFPVEKKSLRFLKYMIIIVVMMVSPIIITTFLSGDSIVAQRLVSTLEEGDMSSRDVIWENIAPYIGDNFILGVGETGYVEITANTMGKTHKDGDFVYGYSPHNVILEVLIYTGVIGFYFMFIFWFSAFKRTWIIFKKMRDMLPMLLFLPIIASLLSGQLLYAKWAYLLFAYIFIYFSSINVNFIRKFH